jgi:hypothetical protein
MYRQKHNGAQRVFGSLECLLGNHKYKMLVNKSEQDYPYCVRCGKKMRRGGGAAARVQKAEQVA